MPQRQTTSGVTILVLLTVPPSAMKTPFRRIFWTFLCASFLTSAFTQTAVPFANCFPNDNLSATVTSVIINQTYVYDTPKIIFFANANTNVPITGGTSLIFASVMGKFVLRSDDDICDILGGCPKGIGAVSATKEITYPNLKGVWGVDVVARMEWYGMNAQIIGCVEAKFAMVEAGGMEDVADALIATIVIGALIVAIFGAGISWFLHGKGSSVNAGNSASDANHMAGSYANLIELLLYFQTISQSGMYNLEYPQWFIRIMAKFSWANYIPYLSSINQAVVNARNGMGMPSDTSYDPNSERGLAHYARLIGIEPRNLFMYTFIVFLVVLAVWTALSIVIRIGIEAWLFFEGRRPKSSKHVEKDSIWQSRSTFWHFYIGNILCIEYLAFFVLVTVSVFQLTVPGDHWGVYFLAVIVFCGGCLAVYLFFAIHLFKFIEYPVDLYVDHRRYLKYGVLYNNYKEYAYMFFVVFLSYRLLSGIIVGAVYQVPIVQMVLLLTVEIGYLFMLNIRNPLNTHFANNMHKMASVLRVLAAFFLLAFIPEVHTNSTTQSVFGYLILALNCLAVTFYVSVPVRNLYRSLKEAKRRKDDAIFMKQMDEEYAQTAHKDEVPTDHSREESITLESSISSRKTSDKDLELFDVE